MHLSMSGVNTAYASQFLLRTVKTATLPKETELKLFRQTALYLPSDVLEAGLKNTTGEIQLELLKALAASPEGKDLILKQVRSGGLYTRILVQKIVCC